MNEGAALARVVSDHHRVTRIARGHSNTVYRVERARGAPVVVRVGRNHGDRYRTEEVVMERAREVGVPCPVVHAIETVEDFDVMVESWIDGDPLTSKRAAGQCGALLAAIHSVRIHGFGTIDASGAGTRRDFSTWFIDDLQDAIDAVSGVDDVVHEIDASRDVWRAFDSTLVHGDFSPPNILECAGRVVGVVDWESAKSGPPALDFGWWDWFGATFGTPFAAEAMLPTYIGAGGSRDAADPHLRHLVRQRIRIDHLAWQAARSA